MAKKRRLWQQDPVARILFVYCHLCNIPLFSQVFRTKCSSFTSDLWPSGFCDEWSGSVDSIVRTTVSTSSYPGWIKSPHVVTLGILKISDLDSLTIFNGGGVFRSKLWSSQIWSFPKWGGVFRSKLWSSQIWSFPKWGGYSGVNCGHPKSEVFRNGGGVFQSKLWSSQIWSFPKWGGVFRSKLWSFKIWSFPKWGGFLVFNSRKGLSGKFGQKFTVQPETCLCITVVSPILRMWRLMRLWFMMLCRCEIY